MSWIKITIKSLRYATCYHENNDLVLLSQFIKDNKIVSYREDGWFGTNVIRFFKNGGKGCGKNFLNAKKYFGSTLIDHPIFFKTKSGQIILTSHPYADVKTIIDEFSSKFSKDFTIEVLGEEKSWYNPGQTPLVIIKLKNIYEKRN